MRLLELLGRIVALFAPRRLRSDLRSPAPLHRSIQALPDHLASRLLVRFCPRVGARWCFLLFSLLGALQWHMIKDVLGHSRRHDLVNI